MTEANADLLKAFYKGPFVMAEYNGRRGGRERESEWDELEGGFLNTFKFYKKVQN